MFICDHALMQIKQKNLDLILQNDIVGLFIYSITNI
jgi:hypothetical protein